jgi:hypothetical protein
MGNAVIEFHYRGTINSRYMTNGELGEIVKNNHVITPEMAVKIVRRILGDHFTTELLLIEETCYTRD